MTEPSWQQARLIPTSGINGAQEQERRATSALLAVMGAVKEYGRSVTKSLGSHAGDIQTFIEVEFDLDGKKVIPDGLIRVTRGSRVWTALLEVKTGRNSLQTEQLENYLEVAKRAGFQALLTISNETPPAAGLHPTKVDRRKSRYVPLHHMAWSEVLSLAVLEKEHRGDPGSGVHGPLVPGRARICRTAVARRVTMGHLVKVQVCRVTHQSHLNTQETVHGRCGSGQGQRRLVCG